MSTRDVGYSGRPGAEMSPPAATTALAQELVDRLDHGLAVFDQGRRLVMANPAFANLLGLPPALARPGTSLADMVEARWDRSPDACCRCLDELASGLPDGTGVLSCRECPGAPEGRALELRRVDLADGVVAVVITDVSRRTHIEQALETSEGNLAAAQRIAHLGSWDLDVTANAFTWSDETYRILGQARGDAAPAYDDLMDTVHPDDRDRVAETVSGALFRRGRYQIEHRIIRPDGTERLVRQQGEVGFAPEGFPARMTGTIQDITDLKQAEQQLRKLSEAVEQGATAIAITDGDGVIEYVNPAFAALTGFAAEEAIGRSLITFKSATTDPAHYRALWQDVISGAVFRGVFENRRKDGSLFWASTVMSPVRAADGTVTHVVSIEDDITEKRLAEERLRNSEERFRGLVEGSLLGIVIDRGGKPVFANARFAEMFGYDSPGDILALESLDLLYAGTDQDMVRRYRRARQAGLNAPTEYEYRGICRNGTRIWVRTHVRQISWHGQPAVQSTVVDITLQKENAERLHRQANYDPVTHLPNRNLALERLHRAIIHARRTGQSLAVLFIDVDEFKQVNDSLGHVTGDRVLSQIAARLRASVREQDTVARLGGDEFAVILPGIGDPANAEAVARKILQAFHRPLLVEDREIFTSTSIGCAIWPDDGADSQALLHSADAAMYRAKDDGRNTVTFFTSELNREAVERQRMRQHLERALINNELSVAYQPVMDLVLGAVAGMEALLRWRSPTLGDVPPSRFIDVAETTGLIVPLGHWVETAVLQHVRLWQSEGLGMIPVSLNVTPRQFREPSFADKLCRALSAADIPGAMVQLDITESLLVADSRHTRDTMDRLKRFGVRLAIDNFGTGGATLSHLSRLPVDAIKIDASLIKALPGDSGNVALVQAMIAMAQRLNIKVIAEGVEQEAELQFLRLHGCNLAQGYYFSRPLDVDATVSFLSAHPRSAG
ncbi:MAG: EAL domain-containing protein [Rhodospirillales bacterium]|nr:MAG: EAL domain-containing protein [Rhodospirillales bacterium]